MPKLSCIINVTRLREAGASDPRPSTCYVLDRRDAPTCFYPEEEADACERELLRLKAAHPDQEFYIFEAVRWASHSFISLHTRVFHVEEFDR